VQTIAIIGLGYVGLPLALEFAHAGCRVLGLDTDPQKPPQLRRGESYIEDVQSIDLKALVDSGRFEPCTDFSRLVEADAILLCVPTPLSDSREPDLQYVVGSARTVARYLRRGQLVVLESTTYPGATEEVVLPLLEESGLRCPLGSQNTLSQPDFYLAFSPERIDPGNRRFPFAKSPK